MRYLTLLSFLLISFTLKSQLVVINGKTWQQQGSVACESFEINVDTLCGGESTQRKFSFIYLGKDSVEMMYPWTCDPHFICDFPRGPMVYGKEYSFTVCFWLKGRYAAMNKQMGFVFSTGERTTFHFTGFIDGRETLPANPSVEKKDN